MSKIDNLINMALRAGFSKAGELKMDALEFLPQVRDMCAADLCHSYAKNWTCPPACGSLEEIAAKAATYKKGLLVQTIGHTEDDFDWDSIEATSQKHQKTFHIFTAKLKKLYPDILPMGAGACSICPICTYPNSPCLHPDLAVISMEAYGLVVSSVCEKSGLPYNYGKNTISFTSAYLIK
ncbi:MAG: DUF2284 domain-containing protein [Clostridiales bacterium]|jgi:predicted metal-binding protein|nr:DUF2284 domain-containing protein [Clostridiales bacterium]